MRRNNILVWLFLLMSCQIFAQQRILISEWSFRRLKLGGIWEVWREQAHEQNLWQQVQTPHCYNAFDAVDPDVEYYQGEAWYKTLIDCKNPYQNGRTILHFEGAGQKTTLWLYDRKVGMHVGGYDEFSFDITDLVEELKQHKHYSSKWNDKIPVAVCVDNSRDLEMIPSDLSDFFIYGGLYRKVYLEYLPEVSIERTHVSSVLSKDFKTAELTINTHLYNPKLLNELMTITYEMYDPKGKRFLSKSKNILSSDSLFTEHFTIKNPLLWSPEQPSLYRVKVIIKCGKAEATYADQFGIRDFYFESKGPFMLNGKRLLLQGTHRHEDHAGYGAAIPDSIVRKEMIMIKEMGANFIRLGHYQQSELVLDLCDSLGILVWEEIPWCRGGLGGVQYQQQAKDMLKSMITQHFNHPAIILWGLGNENDWEGDFEIFDKEAIRSFMKELNVLAHQLDKTRKTSIRRCSFCADIVDVYSPSIWAGWYHGKYKDYKSVSENERKKVNHFFHAEWGADQHAYRYTNHPDKRLDMIESNVHSAEEREGDFLLTGGNIRASKDGDWSESYACNLIDWHLKEQLTMDSLSGSAYWVFKDFATPLRPENPIPFVNQKGVVERDLSPKDAYFIFQSYWSKKPMAHIFGQHWINRWGEQGEKNEVKVFSNCSKVELFINGISFGVKERNTDLFPASGLIWWVPFIPGSNEILVKGYSKSVTIIDRLKINYQIEKWGGPAQLKAEVIEDKDDLVLVRVKFLDDHNIQCLELRNRIIFSLSGDGELVDNLGTIKHSRSVEASNGEAWMYVKKNKGKSVLGISSEGMKTIFLEIN